MAISYLIFNDSKVDEIVLNENYFLPNSLFSNLNCKRQPSEEGLFSYFILELDLQNILLQIFPNSDPDLFLVDKN